MLIYQKIIYRIDVRTNRDVIYLFGDNVARKGRGGQAREMRGEENAIGIATKWFPSMKPMAFFTDERISEQMEIINRDFDPVISHIKSGGTVIVPFDGIGTGLSQMGRYAPLTQKRLFAMINELRNA